MAVANVTAFAGPSFLEARAAGSLGVGLGGAGFMLVYYLGVLEVLQQLGVVDRGEQGGLGGPLWVAAAQSSPRRALSHWWRAAFVCCACRR